MDRTREELTAELRSKTSAKRRKAVKTIGKQGLGELGPALLDAYERERNDPRTWETQVEMIRTLGRLGHRAALPFVQ